MSDSSSLLTGSRKKTAELRKAKLDLAEAKYTEKGKAYSEKSQELKELKESNAEKSAKLNEKSDEIAGRGILASAWHGTIDAGKNIMAMETGEEAFEREVNELVESQKKAIEMQNELADDYEELENEYKAFKEEEGRYLRKEKDLIKKELSEQKKNEKELKKKKEEAIAAGGDTKSIDAKIAENNQKTEKLQEAKKNNSKATSDTRSQSKKSSNSPTQSCPETCDAHDLVVKCAHEGGKRKAKCPPGKSIAELHVVSGSHKSLVNSGVSSKATIDVITAEIQGSCGKGKTDFSPHSALKGVLERNYGQDHCPYIAVTGGSPASDISLPGPLEFEVYSPNRDLTPAGVLEPTWMMFLNYIFRSKKKEPFSTYIIEGGSCDGAGKNSVAKVYAHTPEKWVGEIALGWNASGDGIQNITTEIETDKVCEVSDEEIEVRNFVIEGKVNGHVDGRNLVLGGDINFFKEFTGKFGRLLDFMNRIDKNDDSKNKKDEGYVKCEWIPPKIAFAAEMEIKENPDDNMIDKAYKYALKLDPLIGVKIETDILKALIDLAINCAAPGTGGAAKRFITFIKDNLMESEKKKDSGEGVEFIAEIKMTNEFVLAGEFNTSKKFGSEPITETKDTSKSVMGYGAPEKAKAAELAGVAKMEIVGQIKASYKHKGDYFIVNAEAGAGIVLGAKGGGATEFAVKLVANKPESDDVEYTLESEFKGLILFFMAYAKASVERASSRKEVKNKKTLNRRSTSTVTDGPQNAASGSPKNLKEIWQILKPWNSPPLVLGKSQQSP